MDYKKSKVKVACAGAGKTYAMAEEILILIDITVKKKILLQ